MAADQALAGRIRDYLKAHGITCDAATVAAASPMPAQEIGKGKPGPGRGKKTGADSTRLPRGSDNVEYLAKRLKRDHPAIAAKVEAGGLSIRDGAREAGIVRKLTPLDRLRKAWGAASPEERDEFRREIAG